MSRRRVRRKKKEKGRRRRRTFTYKERLRRWDSRHLIGVELQLQGDLH